MLQLVVFLLLSLFAVPGVHAQEMAPFPYRGQGSNILPQRIALVIGVERYSRGSVGQLNLNDLEGTAKDANEMAELLKSIGFDKVHILAPLEGRSVSRAEFDDKFADFLRDGKKAREETRRGAIMLFFFAGHGVSLDGQNHLLLSDFSANDAEDILEKGISLEGTVVAKLQSPADSGAGEPELAIIVTDACRSGAGSNLKHRTDGRAANVSRGIYKPRATAPKERAKNHVMFLYATLEGNPAFGAADVGGRFTRAIITSLKNHRKAIQEQTLRVPSLRQIFDDAKTAMTNLSVAKLQTPTMNDDWASPFYPITTAEYFELERTRFNQVINPEPTGYQCQRQRVHCGCQQFLKQFSEYSYFSPKIIAEINAWNALLDKPDCETVNQLGCGGVIAETPTHVQGRWNLSIARAGREGFNRSAPNYRVASSTLLRLAQTDAPSATLGAAPRQVAGEARRPTFGDIRPEFGKMLPKSPPEDSVPLDNLVVTKGHVYLTRDHAYRTQSQGESMSLGVLAPGEFLEIMGTSPTRKSLEVKHTTFGQGFVAGDQVEPALVKISKTLGFKQNQFQLDEQAKTSLAASFGLLGGVAVVDAVVDYPATDGLLGVARASAIEGFVDEIRRSIVSSQDKPRKRVVFAMRAIKQAQPDFPSDSARVTVLGIPFDARTRAAIANQVGSDNRVILKPTPTAIGGKEKEPDIYVCKSDSPSKCRAAAPPDPDNKVRTDTQEVLKGLNPVKSFDLQRVAPFKF